MAIFGVEEKGQITDRLGALIALVTTNSCPEKNRRTMLPAVVARTTISTLSRRSLSTAVAGPKLHKAKGNWEALKAKRPIDQEDLHVSDTLVFVVIFRFQIPYPYTVPVSQLVFTKPYDTGTVFLLVGSMLGIGVGSMVFGVRHQQYKQGYWK
jgi:hypothetical protein